MAVAMQSRTTSGTAVSRKAQVASTSRPVARAFTSSRPAAVVSRVSSSEVRRVGCVATRAVASPESTSSQKPGATKEWYALVCNAEWLFMDPQNESIAEQLRERVRFYKEQNRENDMFIVPEPVWLEKKYPEQAKQVRKPCVAIVSSDKMWIVFMKLRLDRVLKIDLGAITEAEATAVGGTLPDFKPSGKWTAPYARYTPGWWNVFIPKQQ